MLSTFLMAASMSLQPATSALTERLVADGFENVAVQVRRDRTFVWFEDRRYLDAIDGLGKVAREIAASPFIGSVELVPLHEQLPVLGIEIPAEDLRQFLNKRQSARAFASQLGFELAPPDPPSGVANSSTWHSDLALTPGYAFSVHLYGYVNPTLHTQLGPGWQAQGRLQLQFYPQGEISPDFLLLGGHRSVAPGIDGAWLMGRWDDQHYGGVAELAGLLGGGDWQWHLQAGLVTDSDASAIASMDYHFPWLDTFTRFGAGFYPAGDRCAFVTFGRLFPRSEVEAGYYRSDFGNQLRATITTYLGPDVRPIPGPLRFEGLGSFSADYRASAPKGGTSFWPEPDAGEAWTRLTPDNIRRHLQDWR